MSPFTCATRANFDVAFRTNMVAGQTKGAACSPLGTFLGMFDPDIVHRTSLFTAFAGRAIRVRVEQMRSDPKTIEEPTEKTALQARKNSGHHLDHSTRL